MGKTIRWFKNLMEKKKQKDQNSYDKDKRRWSLPTVPEIEAEAELVNSHYNKTDGDLNKQAIAVVTATAAAVDAALVAAYATVEMVRLTIDGRKTIFSGDRETWAAVKIQSIFRGYLARKALRALKGVVKVQAHIRGFLVRKQAASTLSRMQALMRAKQVILSQRAQQRTFIENFERTSSEHRTSIQRRRQSSRFNLVKSPEIVDMNICRAISRSRRTNASPLQCPNYMTNTRSFMAKVRSSPGRMGKDESRASFSRAEMERSCSRVEKAFYLKNAGLARLEKLRGVC